MRSTEKREFIGRSVGGRKLNYDFFRLEKAGDYIFIPMPDDVLTAEDKKRFDRNLRSSAHGYGRRHFEGDNIRVKTERAENLPDFEEGTPGFGIYRTSF